MRTVRPAPPKTRDTPTKTPSEGNWSDHKPDLKEDYHSHCAYCGSFDGYRHTYYEVDHFIPKKFFRENSDLSDIDYANLVYSCKFCNGKKSSKWPTESMDLFNDGSKGFVDPRDPDYENHIFRRLDGSLHWKTDLGQWIVQKAFKFDLRSKELSLLYSLKRMNGLIFELIKVEQNLKGISAELDSQSQDLYSRLTKMYLIADNQLKKHYDSI